MRNKIYTGLIIIIFIFIGACSVFSDTTNQCISEVSIYPVGLEDIIVVAGHSRYVQWGGDCLHDITQLDKLTAEIYDATEPEANLLITIDLIYYGGDQDLLYFVGMAKYPVGADHAIVYHPGVPSCRVDIEKL